MINKNKKHTYKSLKIWEIGMDIADEVYECAAQFPIDERYGLSSQIKRSSVSIPSNVAEGSSRGNSSFSYFLDVSLGSSFELDTQLLIALRRNFLRINEYENVADKIAEFQRMAIGFQRKLNQ
ncbi:MAG: diversity-generating retroelement protein bAvd family protein [Flavobacteriales bacterium]|nr:diversity-generating retroelement protein bAvd family protein [Flavobacteriales bacterium]|tara:strand:+ start:333 stop:701 length:369 start_codon:yes stop_codon:yes gene_type:complete